VQPTSRWLDEGSSFSLHEFDRILVYDVTFFPRMMSSIIAASVVDLPEPVLVRSRE